MCAQNWPACAEWSSSDQKVQKLKYLADFPAILFTSSALSTTATCTKQFGVKLIKYFAKVCE